jgi:hypothetical protein
MGRGGRRARAAVALAAGALPFALGVGTASADDFFIQFFSKDHTFTAGDGSTVTCTVSGESSLTRAPDEEVFDGEALTRASGEHPSCGVTFVSVDVTYVDPSGRQKHTGADSIDGDVRWFVDDDVAHSFRVVHRVSFDDCRANCDVSFTTQPK